MIMSPQIDVGGLSQSLIPYISSWVSTLMVGLFLFGMFWVGGILIERIWVRLAHQTHQQLRSVFMLFGRTMKILIILVGALTGLGTVGVDLGAVIAGLGLTGFALGFALKDAISNVLAGMLIMLYQPFKLTDWIFLTGLGGVVEDINLRYTILRDQGGKQILIPNSLLFTNSITVSQAT
jgi:small conductance mechanosensitive channel